MSTLTDLRTKIKLLFEDEDLHGNLVKDGMDVKVAKGISRSKAIKAAIVLHQEMSPIFPLTH